MKTLFKKVCIICNNDNNSRLLINQTLSLYDKKNIFLICPNFNGYLKNGNNKIIHNNTFIKYIFFFINIFKSIKKEKKFLFHLRGFPSSLVFFIFKMFKKINYIYDPRGLYIDEINESKKKIRLFSPIFRIIEKKIINNSIFVIVTSNKFKKKLYKLYKTNKEMLILYNSSFITRGLEGLSTSKKLAVWSTSMFKITSYFIVIIP